MVAQARLAMQGIIRPSEAPPAAAAISRAEQFALHGEEQAAVGGAAEPDIVGRRRTGGTSRQAVAWERRPGAPGIVGDVEMLQPGAEDTPPIRDESEHQRIA